MFNVNILIVKFIFASMLFYSNICFSLPKPPKSTLENVDCWFEIEKDWPTTSCFYLQVYEQYDNPQSLLIRFPIVRFSSGTVGKNPVLDLGGGGPGNPAGLDKESISRYTWLNYKHLSLEIGRDLYLIDPRGVGMAQPRLFCQEFIDIVTDAWKRKLYRAQENELALAADKKCFERWSQKGHDIKSYNSLSVAKDIELMKTHFGIKKWNLVGVSYASRYALTYAREYPNSVDAMVLDGVVFPHLRYEERQAKNFSLALQKAFQRCKRDPKCKQAFPNLGQRFWQLVKRLNNDPLNMAISEPFTNEKIEIILTGERFFDVIFDQLYDETFHAKFPGIVKSIEMRNSESITSAVEKYLEYLLDANVSDVVIASHYCYEEYPFIDDKKRILNSAEENDFLAKKQLDTIEFEKKWCKLWLSGVAAPRSEVEPVHTSIPTLFIHGKLDPILPFEDVEAQMKYFKNWAFLIFDDYSHSVITSSLCAEKMAGMFYERQLDYGKHTNCFGN